MQSIQIQTVLFNSESNHLENWIYSIWNCVSTLNNQYEVQIKIAVNDSDQLKHAAYKRIISKYNEDNLIELRFFPENLGHGGAHNKLAEMKPDADYYWIINPDGYADLDCLHHLLTAAESSNRIGAVEARQIPFDHPKKFSSKSLVTSWVSGACVLFKGNSFRGVSGFDSTFFLHGDDIDISWRIRATGAKLLFVPNALFFHDKKIMLNGYPSLSSAEAFYGPLGALLLSHKFDLLRGKREMLRELKKSTTKDHQLIFSIVASLPRISLKERIHLRLKFFGIRKYYSGWKFSKNNFS